MKARAALTMGRLHGSALLAGLIALPTLSIAASAQQFFVQQLADGTIRMVDGGGADVTIVDGDPIGTRPDPCPSDAYYLNHLASDKAQLVLTDCATGRGTYTVGVNGSFN
jgi:hypothetical protein